MALTRTDAIRISKAIDEYTEMFEHLRRNTDALLDLQRRGQEVITQRKSVMTNLEDSHALLSDIKAKQQTLIVQERELENLEHGIFDQIKALMDESSSIIDKIQKELI